jgi:hypothetical protein
MDRQHLAKQKEGEDASINAEIVSKSNPRLSVLMDKGKPSARHAWRLATMVNRHPFQLGVGR